MAKTKKPNNPIQAAKSGGIQVAFPGGFGRAAEKLAGTINHVVDLFAGPECLRRHAVAKAEGEAAAMVIRAEGRARVRGIEARTVARVQNQEVRRQENIESIVRKAVDELPPPDQVSEQPVEPDWVSRFFRECQDVSDKQMQLIWARILAGEVGRPGTFSPGTLSVVRDLTKSDADHFAKLCGFTWIIPALGPAYVPVIHNANAQYAGEVGINFGILTHLTSVGLVEFSGVGTFSTEGAVTEVAPSYCGRVHQLKSDGGVERVFPFGHVMFTVVGLELFPIANAEGSERIETAALDAWSAQGWKEATVVAVADLQQSTAPTPPQNGSVTPLPVP
jgi:hypothetical protein